MDTITPALAAAAIYTGLLILMSVVLQVRVVLLRRARQVGIGDGQDKELGRAIRVHGNFTESVPFGIAGLLLLALLGAQAILIHGLGLMLVAGRVLHAIGLSRTAGSSPGRVAGMMLTFGALVIMGVTIVLIGLWR